MSQMSPSQARIIDPLVTELALAYRTNGFIGTRLFPRVNVGQRAGKIPLFDREGWRRVASKHAPGANIPQVQIAYSNVSFSLVDRILHGKVPRELQEEAGAVPGIDLRAQSLQRVQDLIALDVEMAASDLARNAANYAASNKVTLSGAARWTQSGSTPIADVIAARSVIRRNTGVDPNVLAVSQVVFDALTQHAQFVDRLKYTSSASVTAELMARLFGVQEVVVGAGSYLDDSDTAVDIWGKDAVLAYVPKGGTFLTPSYGYSYSLRGYPYAGQTYWQEETHSWLVPWTDVVEPYLTGVASGFLFVNAGDAS